VGLRNLFRPADRRRGEMAEERNWTHRTTEQARKALGDFCRSAGNRCPACQARHANRGESIHIFSVPVNYERDADYILSDVIDERDALRAQVEELRRGTPN
jgi:hypothetical protein